ncbi:GNAT family N-acetyltransferase [Paraglaciecola sp. 2405UD69-4]|uniref:GNAT family N-acetyltransferase n=1 Tax=Paraglaciecola sp. 2405UD69-4 TaxID=3391836 RepID=UPI0039C990E0
MDTANLTLQDEFITLEPLSVSHKETLYELGQDKGIWTWTSHNYCETLEITQGWIEACLLRKELGTQLPFVIVDKCRNKVVGATSYLNICKQHKTVEVGYTFLHPRAQKTHINRRCKFQMLNHAFEGLGFNRVAFQTHEKNQQSRTAILGLGAQFEGINRYARIQSDGSIRNSAVYSIIKPDWPAVKAHLKGKLTTPKSGRFHNVCS